MYYTDFPGDQVLHVLFYVVSEVCVMCSDPIISHAEGVVMMGCFMPLCIFYKKMNSGLLGEFPGEMKFIIGGWSFYNQEDHDSS